MNAMLNRIAMPPPLRIPRPSPPPIHAVRALTMTSANSPTKAPVTILVKRGVALSLPLVNAYRTAPKMAVVATAACRAMPW